jgi:alcohol dehydrogenase
MKAWRLDGLGGTLSFTDVPVPEIRPGSVLVRIEASALMSYLKAYVAGQLPMYSPPKGAFTPGTNGVGVVQEVGRDVWHIKPGQRVVLWPPFIAGENVEEPAQILVGLTAFGPCAEQVQADWRDGTLAEYALMPKACVTPADGLSEINSAQLSVAMRYIVPFGGLLRGRLTAGETLVVTAATGAYGSAAVLLAIAMGAGGIVAAGRNAAALEALSRAGGPRVVPGRSPAMFRQMRRHCVQQRMVARKWRSTWSARLAIPMRHLRTSAACVAAEGRF